MLQESSRWGLRVSVARHLFGLTPARWTSSEPSPGSSAGGRPRTRCSEEGGRRFSSPDRESTGRGASRVPTLVHIWRVPASIRPCRRWPRIPR